MAMIVYLEITFVEFWDEISLKPETVEDIWYCCFLEFDELVYSALWKRLRVSPVISEPSILAPRRFEWNSPGNLCQITRKIRNEEPEWTATRYCFLGWV